MSQQGSSSKGEVRGSSRASSAPASGKKELREPKFHCAECGQDFASRDQLRDHEAEHNGS